MSIGGRTAVSGVDTVLFDLGGVLTLDPWQTMFLTPERGLADLLQLPRDVVQAAGERLWAHYSLHPATEAQYWTHVTALVGREIDKGLVESLWDLILANPRAAEAFAIAGGRGVRWGVISDNTPFWFPLQRGLLGMESADENLMFLSYEHGLSKSTSGRGLFELAAQRLDPAATAVIDDRTHNLERAEANGFVAVPYSFCDDPTGQRLVAIVDELTGDADGPGDIPQRVRPPGGPGADAPPLGMDAVPHRTMAAPQRAPDADPDGRVEAADARADSARGRAAEARADSARADSARAVDAMLAEYATLRQESLASITNRITVANFAFGAVAVIIAALLANTTANLTKGLIALIFVPQIAKAGLLIWLGEYERSQRAGRAVSMIERKVNREVRREEPGRRAMDWESRLISRSTHMSYPYQATVYILLGAGWASALLGVYNIAFALRNVPAAAVWGVAAFLLAAAVWWEMRFRRFVFAQWHKIRASDNKDSPEGWIL